MKMQSTNLSDGSGYTPPPTLNEINVTPLVDVMLVLLIIFMVSAPLMQQGVQVDLPKTDSPVLNDQEEQIVLVIHKDGKVSINKNPIAAGQLRTKLRAIYENKRKKEIFIQSDQTVPYGTVAEVMSQVQLAGISKIGLVTEPRKKR